MKANARAAVITLCLVASLTPWRSAAAAVSQWTQVQGTRIRLLLDASQAGSATMPAAVEIDLAPGWKTYWRNPGDTGVPPVLDLSGSINVAGATLSFPPPRRYREAGYVWAGYEGPVAFLITLKLNDPRKPVRLRGSLMLGICRHICVPVDAKFDVSAVAGEPDPLARTLVLAAQSKLPRPASPDFGVTWARREGGNLTFSARLPKQGTPAELFVSGGEALATGTPRLISLKQGGGEFSAPVTGGTHEKDGTSVRLFYTLVQGDQSSAGEIATR